MAIIERKQLTGSTAKINQYAGHEGQLVFDKQTKHLHVLSGTAGQSTKLANVSDVSTLIPKTGNRGVISGWEEVEENNGATGQYVIQATSADTMKHTLSAEVGVLDGDTDSGWTKVVYMTAGTVALGSKWVWAGGSVPTLKFPGILVCHWNKGGGIANFVPGAS